MIRTAIKIMTIEMVMTAMIVAAPTAIVTMVSVDVGILSVGVVTESSKEVSVTLSVEVVFSNTLVVWLVMMSPKGQR